MRLIQKKGVFSGIYGPKICERSESYLFPVFVLLQRRSQRLKSDWTSAVIDIPKRRHQRIEYLQEAVTLSDYEGTVRQIAVQGLEREQATLFLTNNDQRPARELIENYAYRNGIGLPQRWCTRS